MVCKEQDIAEQIIALVKPGGYDEAVAWFESQPLPLTCPPTGPSSITRVCRFGFDSSGFRVSKRGGRGALKLLKRLPRLLWRLVSER